MTDRYPGYNVMDKRDTPSWNELTRKVIDERLATPNTPTYLSDQEWQTLNAICNRIVPQTSHRPAVPVAALVQQKLADDNRDGHRQGSLPPLREAWRRGLATLDAAARTRHNTRFCELDTTAQDQLLHAMQDGELTDLELGDMPAETFFKERLAHDILAAYYSHPTSWNEIGFGGPASPRGYVRMYFNRRDPWEAVEDTSGHTAEVTRDNKHVR
ncbi:gluconate 2-dehydrogenase subunit 3 family protein [Alcaligenaceae bacterium]|nr:gluconate 2-dehydrogenase subunit 3 family protein [Alcaligenaceae bacterium]